MKTDGILPFCIFVNFVTALLTEAFIFISLYHIEFTGNIGRWALARKLKFNYKNIVNKLTQFIKHKAEIREKTAF